MANGILAVRPDHRSGRPFLYLASRSERRGILLAQLGIPHEALDIEVDEGWDGREAPCRYVRRGPGRWIVARRMGLPLCETALLVQRIGNGGEPVDHV